MTEEKEEKEKAENQEPVSSEQETNKEASEEIKEEAKEEVKAEEVKEEKAETSEEIKAEEVKEEETEAAEAEKTEGVRKWYVIQTFSGQEDKVRDAIDRTVETMNMKHKIFKVLVPEEETVEIKNGKRYERVKKMFPGYVFVEMMLDDESWYVIRQTPGVAKFIGNKVMPTAVSDREMQRVLKQIGVKEEKIEAAFEVGEIVRIISGPFRGYTGTIDEVNSEKGKLKTLINIFGRDTPVEVSFEQVEKVV